MSPILLSPRSSPVAAARLLRRAAGRREAARFLVEGPQALREAAAAGALVELFATPAGAARHPELVGAVRGPCHLVDERALAALADTVTPQGLVGVAPLLGVGLGDALGAAPRLVCVLVEPRDPGNVGTVVRCADAAGADAVVLTGAAVDPHNGKTVRASAGSLWHLPISAGGSLAETVAALRQAGLRIVAAHGYAERDLDAAQDDGDLAVPTAWLFGPEAAGLPAAALELADAALAVPLHGRAESLNLAAAAAVCLYASARALRARRWQTPGP